MSYLSGDAANTRLVCVAANFGMNQWGVEVLTEVAKGVMGRRGKPAAGEPTATQKVNREWIDAQQRKVDKAEQVARGLSGGELRKQRGRIAALKRNLTLGQEGLARAGAKAALARRKAKQEWVNLRQRLIEEAEGVALGLSGPALQTQRHRIAALKRNLTLGAAGLARAGQRAAIARKSGEGGGGASELA